MNDQTIYTPPKVWTWDKENGGKFSKLEQQADRRATHEKKLPVGENPLQLYSLATPNGVKATVMLEELLERGHKGAEYDAHIIRIGDGDQFGSDFVAINPNSRSPPCLTEVRLPRPAFSESVPYCSILRTSSAISFRKDPAKRAECLNWLFWQMGSAPYLGGGFGHFYAYAPEKFEYPINRFAMETKRQLDVLDRQLAETAYIAGDEYTIADIAIWPWYGVLAQSKLYNDAGTFLEVSTYKNVQRWTKEIADRKAVKRGRVVNRVFGESNEQLENRYSAADIDKLGL